MKNYPIKIFGLLAITILSILAYNTVKDKKGNIEYFSFGRELKESEPEKTKKPLEVQSDILPTTNILSDNLEYGNTNNKIELLVIPSSGFNIKLGNASLSGDIGSISGNAMLSINGLTETELPPLDAGMVNVTGDYSLYRMLPHGAHFLKYIDIVLPYDKSLLPIGYKETDINTYYYDEKIKRWVVLERESVDIAKGIVVSKVNHFTDFINAIIKVPEMPETQAYTPTTMSGIQAANPLESFNFIQPPVANNNGTVNLSFPIDIPAGRQGMQPNLAITYNSNKGNGLLGLGWDLVIPEITVETRWGVPQYNIDKESESYLLNGEQLVLISSNINYLAHRSGWVTRVDREAHFAYRVEGTFDKIIRYGSSPDNYWWEVTDKNGVKYTYKNNEGNIGKWMLTMIEDRYGNYVKYKYRYSGVSFPDEITYTGFGQDEGKYKIEFILMPNDLNATTTARLGYIENKGHLLKDIIISYSGEKIKQYRFFYQEGAFYKSLLKCICELKHSCLNDNYCSNNYEYDPNYLITLQTFSYFEGPEEMFGPAIEIETGEDRRANGLLTQLSGSRTEVSSLGGSTSESIIYGGAASAGIGFNPFLKSASGGYNHMRSNNKTDGLLSIIDMDGDGLPDKLFKDNENNVLFYRKQYYNGSNNKYEFSNPRQLRGLRNNSFLKEESGSRANGAEAHVVGTFGYNKTKSKNTTTIYLHDVNGDGLPDIIDDGYVYYNKLVSGVPYFNLISRQSMRGSNTNSCSNSYASEINIHELSSGIDEDLFNVKDSMIIIPNYGKGGYDVTYDTIWVQSEIDNLDREHDLVKLWIAPYSGVVKVSGRAVLTENLMEKRIANKITDGMKISIQKEDVILYSRYIYPDRPDTNHELTIDVKKGDHIYFRLESISSRLYDIVNWSPTIIYEKRVFVPGESAFVLEENMIKDADDKYIYKFNSSDDFLINPKRKYYMPFDGVISIESIFEILERLSSNVSVTILKNNLPIYYSSNMVDVTSQVINFVDNDSDTHHNSFRVNEGDSIEFIVSCNTNVNWSAIKWKPKLYYISADDESIIVFNTTTNGTSISTISYDVIPYFTDYPKSILPTYRYTPTTNLLINNFNLNLIETSETADYFISIKDNNGSILEYNITLSEGDNNITLPSYIILYANNLYFFDLYCRNNDACKNIIKSTITINESIHIYNGLHTMHNDEDLIFGNLYKNWGQFNYLNTDRFVTQPIDRALLTISNNIINGANNPDLFLSEDYRMDNEVFIFMDADYKNNQWVGYLGTTYLTADTMSNAGNDKMPDLFGDGITCFEEIVHTPYPSERIDGVKVIAPKKQTTSVNHALALGVAVPFASIGTTNISGNIKTISDYLDVNGDKYPDVISPKEVQLSSQLGGLSSKKINHYIRLGNGIEYYADEYNYVGDSKNYGASFTTAMLKALVRKSEAIVDINNGSGANVSGNNGTNQNYSTCTWLDVNGDGLPDKIVGNGEIYLNCGYTFINYGSIYGGVRDGDSKSFGLSAGGVADLLEAGVDVSRILGDVNEFNVCGTSFSGGLGFNNNKNRTSSTYIDINGDGLPDNIYLETNNDFDYSKIFVNYNTGTSFSVPQEILNEGDQISFIKSYTGNVNISFSFGFSFTFLPIKFTINPQVSKSWEINQINNQFIDMNGDGYVDYVTSKSIDKIKVRYNQTGKANLLKSVSNIANGEFIVDYDLTQNSFASPYRYWTMSNLNSFDGHIGDGIDTLQYYFHYQGANYDRYERENMGFANVISIKSLENPISNLGENYRAINESYHNNDYLRKGLKYNELLYSKTDKKYIEKEYNYALHDIITGDLISYNDFCRIGYPALAEEIVKYYEEYDTAKIITKKIYEYGPYGNIIRYSNIGDIEDLNDDIITSITYHSDTNNLHVLNVPKSVIVRDNSSTILRKKETLINDEAKIKRLLIHNNTLTSDFDYSYDNYGNLKVVEHPQDNGGNRLEYIYTYDDLIHTYITNVNVLPFSYNSSSTYDYKWGKVTKTKDINSNTIEYEYDWRGRLTKVIGPYEDDYTLKFFYWLEDNNVNYSMVDTKDPWAITYHYDEFYRNDPLTTTLFCDSFGRITQTKKDMHIDDKEVSTVSGKVLYDSYGRIMASYYPTIENIEYSQNEDEAPEIPLFNADFDDVQPMLFTYDLLDRILVTKLQDGSETTYDYDFGNDFSSNIRFLTTVTDANNKVVKTYYDSKGQQTMINKSVGNTTFEFNALGELLRSTDPDNMSTSYTYDMVGQLTMREHPDAGTDIYAYDRIGNMISHKTQNLINSGSEIIYKYYYNFLTSIQYPNNPENNVKYKYGDNQAQNNCVGRLEFMEDATGWQSFSYGKLGEQVSNIKTFILPYENNLFTFKTYCEYDTWGRIKNMIYPDGENVFYYYNRGGLLEGVKGQKESEEFSYIKSIGYNKFEKKVHTFYNNDNPNSSKNYYLYDDLQRLINLKSTSSTEIMNDIVYTYDNVGNIIELKSNDSYTLPHDIGGIFSHRFNYDDDYRLEEANGEWRNDNVNIEYNLGLSYSNNGRILRKRQNYSTFLNGRVQDNYYDKIYSYYSSRPNALRQVSDNLTQNINHIKWDANGNMLCQVSDDNNLYMVWNEENRLMASTNDASNSFYIYQDNGERVYKFTGEKQGIYVNGYYQSYDILNNPTLYVSPYLVANQRGYTKHIYAGSERIASKIGGGGLINIQAHIHDNDSDKRARLEFNLKNTFELELGKTITAEHNKLNVLYDFERVIDDENEIYYYSNDHLGSTSWITDKTGEAIEHIHYLPFGETFVSEKKTYWSAPYTFSGKERDAETGFSYFGARYYDANLGIWLSVDPLAAKYQSTSPYAYCRNNPIMLVDPNGMSDSPYYDANGNFLGVDEKGFTGEIYITDKATFDANSKNGVADSKSIQASSKTQSIKRARINELSMKTQSKIYTHVLNQMSDIDFSNLYNGEVSINTRKNINGNRIEGYNNPDDYDRFGFNLAEGSTYKITARDGHHKIDLSTVEAIQSYLGVHEYYGHGIKAYSGPVKLGGTHWKAYDAQLKHPTFKLLLPYLQHEIINTKKTYMKIENPTLYKQIYK